jgi:Family of unknown function (DUF5677)
MSGPPPITVVAGFPEMWNPVAQKYKPFFAAVEQLVSLHNRVIRVPVEGQALKVVGSLLHLMTNDYGAVLALVMNGYGVQAMKIVRSMFEAECNIHYLKNNPDAVNDYVDFNIIERKDLYNLMDDEQKSKLDPADVASMLAEYDAIVPRFTKNGKIRRDWCEKTLYQRAEAAGLKELYVTMYRWTCSMHHADFSSIVFSHDARADDLNMAPSDAWLYQALVNAHGSFLRALHYYIDMINVSFESEMQELVTQYKEACKIIEVANPQKQSTKSQPEPAAG